MQITLDQAERLLRAAKQRAADIGVAVSVVDMDAAGHLKAFYRMDAAWLGSIDVAMKKARTAALFEVETRALWDVCKPDAQAPGLESTNGGLITFAGGIPIKTAGGDILGSIGVSGGQVAQDLDVARAALAASVEQSGSPEMGQARSVRA